ncbi:phosphatidate cytidylyltransferase [Rhodopila sp.]|uniref:phosphatidate cytidylyltransferase n=1 Tax=Rhodopila sp. TaxID=2480087 RepID=UPI003D0B1A05
MLARTDLAADRQPSDHVSPLQDIKRVGPPTPRWGDLRLRILSAAVLAPLALGCIWIGGLAFAGLIALISIGLSYEWLAMCGKHPSPPVKLLFALLFAALPLAVALMQRGHSVSALALLAVATLSGIALDRHRLVALGIPYLGLAALALVWLRCQTGSGNTSVGFANVFVLLLVIWASDVGAYIAGRAIGGWRLAPRISPAKTWSGVLGGVIAAATVGFAASAILGTGLGSPRAAGFAALIAVVAQAGDLFESHLKRQFGVKDSGSMIPGHGGLLDRLDAVLTAAPATALLALILGSGVVLWK